MCNVQKQLNIFPYKVNKSKNRIQQSKRTNGHKIDKQGLITLIQMNSNTNHNQISETSYNVCN